MKTLLLAPLFFVLPWSSAFAAKSYEVPAETTGGGSATSNTSTSRSEPEPSAKKASRTPAAPSPAKPKSNRTAGPAYLFME